MEDVNLFRCSNCGCSEQSDEELPMSWSQIVTEDESYPHGLFFCPKCELNGLDMISELPPMFGGYITCSPDEGTLERVIRELEFTFDEGEEVDLLTCLDALAMSGVVGASELYMEQLSRL